MKRKKNRSKETKASTGKELVDKRWNKDTTADSAPVSFVEDTSNKTGVSSRVIHEEIQISKNLTPEIKKQIKGNKHKSNRRY